MITDGRDKYGEVRSPLFAAMLDRRTMTLFEAEGRRRLWGIRLDDWPNWRIRNRDRTFKGANLHHDEDFVQSLYALTYLTGEKRYAAEADKTLAWFFTNCQSPVTGLLAWGEHMGWDFRTEQAIRDRRLHNGEEMVVTLTHEFARAWVLWERSFDLAPRACGRFARGLWENQIGDKTNGNFSRHAWYDRRAPDVDSEFPRHGGFYIAAWAEAYRREHDPVYARAIETLVDGFDSRRGRETDAVPAFSGEPGNIAWLMSSISLAIDLSDGAAKMPEPLAGKMRKCATRTDDVFLGRPHDLSPGGKGYLTVIDLHTGKPLGAGSFTAVHEAPGVAVLCLVRHEQTGRDGYKKLGLAAADALLMRGPDAEFALHPGQLGAVIYLLLRAHEITGQQKYLDRADHFARWAVELFFDDASPLPKATSKHDHYEAVSGAGTLAMSLVKLWAAQNRPDKKPKFNWSGR